MSFMRTLSETPGQSRALRVTCRFLVGAPGRFHAAHVPGQTTSVSDTEGPRGLAHPSAASARGPGQRQQRGRRGPSGVTLACQHQLTVRKESTGSAGIEEKAWSHMLDLF